MAQFQYQIYIKGAMELNVNEEITCKGQNHTFSSNKYTFQALYQALQQHQ